MRKLSKTSRKLVERCRRYAVKRKKVEGGEKQGGVWEFLKGSNRTGEELVWLWNLE